MPTINGPKVQPPGAILEWFDIVRSPDGGIVSITPGIQAMQFFHAMQAIDFNVSRSGPTASRPTSTLDNRWIGMPFYDTTLGKPIFLNSVNPDVWHDGAGGVV
jgi:hypothetical protein